MKPRTFTLALLLVLAVLVPILSQPTVHATSGTELIQNGGFETGKLSPEWIDVYNKATIETTIVHTGTYAVQAVGPGDVVLVHPCIVSCYTPTFQPVNAGDSFSFAAYFNETNSVAQVDLHFATIGPGPGQTFDIYYWLSAEGNVGGLGSNSSSATVYLLLNEPVDSWIVVTRNVVTDLTAGGLQNYQAYGVSQLGLTTNQQQAKDLEVFDDFSYVDPPPYTLATSITPNGAGSISLNPPGGEYDESAQVQATASSNSGYVFANWTMDGVPAGNSNPITITMNAPHALTANYQQTITVPVTLTVTAKSGSTLLSGVQVTWNGTTQATDFNGQTTFTSPLGSASLSINSTYTVGNITYTFQNWNDSSTDNPRTLDLQSDLALTAEYEASVNVTVDITPRGDWTMGVFVDNVYIPSLPQNFTWVVGSQHNLTAAVPAYWNDSASAYYVFKSWSDGGARSHIVTVPGSPITYTANYELGTTVWVTITSSPNGDGYITIDGSPLVTPNAGPDFVGDNFTLSANSSVNGGNFLYWDDNGVIVQQSTIQVTVTGNATYAAIYDNGIVVTQTLNQTTTETVPGSTTVTETVNETTTSTFYRESWIFETNSTTQVQTVTTVISNSTTQTETQTETHNQTQTQTLNQTSTTVFSSSTVQTSTVSTSTVQTSTTIISNSTTQTTTQTQNQTSTQVETSLTGTTTTITSATGSGNSGFTLLVNPATISIPQAGEGEVTIAVAPLGSNPQQVYFNSQPIDSSGVVVSIAPQSGTPPFAATATIQIDITLEVGTFTVPVYATDGAHYATATITVHVTPPTNEFELTATPSTVTVQVGRPETFDLILQVPFDQPYHNITGTFRYSSTANMLPAGFNITGWPAYNEYSINHVGGFGFWITVSVDRSVPVGAYTLAVTVTDIDTYFSQTIVVTIIVSASSTTTSTTTTADPHKYTLSIGIATGQSQSYSAYTTLSLAPAGGSYPAGTQVQVAADFTEMGLAVDHWSLDGQNIGSKNPVTVTMDSDHEITLYITPPPSSGNNGGGQCIIATAAYGSPMAPEVVYMRFVRDSLIGSTPTGKEFRDAAMWFYYLWSPYVANWISTSDSLRALFRILLIPLDLIISATATIFNGLGKSDLAAVTAFDFALIMSLAVYVALPIRLVREARRHRSWRMSPLRGK